MYAVGIDAGVRDARIMAVLSRSLTKANMRSAHTGRLNVRAPYGKIRATRFEQCRGVRRGIWPSTPPLCFLGLVAACSFHDISYLQSGTSTSYASGGGGEISVGGAGNSGQGGATPRTGDSGTGGSGTNVLASGGSTVTALEPDPNGPVLDCGSKPCSDPYMIADMENNDGTVCSTNGRAGAVYYFNDGTGAAWPPAGGDGPRFSPLSACRGTSAVALHIRGVNFTIWGSGTGIHISDTGWDASAYSGLIMWARSDTKSELSIGVATTATQDVAYGGKCEPSGGRQCGDHFATQRTLTSTWQAYQISFSELRQGGWGVVAPTANIDTTAVMELDLITPPATSFDIWLDDIGFAQ